MEKVTEFPETLEKRVEVLENTIGILLNIIHFIVTTPALNIDNSLRATLYNWADEAIAIQNKR